MKDRPDTPLLPIRTERIISLLEELSAFSDSTSSGITRVLFSSADIAARKWLKDRLQEAGLAFREDAVGNLFARWEGEEPELPAIATGSHIDAVPLSGRFDGTVGVIGALEAFRALREGGFRPRRSLELVVFTAEEPTRFGISCLGSRVLAGRLCLEELETLRDKEDQSFAQLRQKAGLGDIPFSSIFPPRYAAFLELHIEQGPILEREGKVIGAVEAIAAPAAYRVRWDGVSGHAGTVLMFQRRDALAGAAEGILVVERVAKELGSIDAVATVGEITVSPGTLNSIAGSVTMGIDLRDIDLERRHLLSQAIRGAFEEIAKRRGLKLSWQVIYEDPPALSDPGLVTLVLESAHRLGFAARPMKSRAYHDSLFMALLCPVVMIFIPCREGKSHCPEEYSSPQQIEAGVRVLADCLMKLAS